MAPSKSPDLPVDPNALALARVDHDRLVRGQHDRPHALLGAHPCSLEGRAGFIVRAFHPAAAAASVLVDGEARPMHALSAGLFAAFVPSPGSSPPYRLRFAFEGGAEWETDDGYRFAPTVGPLDLHLFGEGKHRRLYEVLGARPMRIEDVAGTAFAVWAPRARRVSVVGDFCAWDGLRYPMRRLGGSGVFELFVPGVGEGDLYKFEILTAEGALRLKTDPFARAMEEPPGTASCVTASRYRFGDDGWMAARGSRDPTREPMAIYEVHLGSWMRDAEGRFLGYREIAPRLIEHVRSLGFTHVELMPIAEHAFYGSWGYQVTGFYAPTRRYGAPDDLRFFVDSCHRAGIGVLLDWVPAHFPRDDFALRRFDGGPLYEHPDPRRGEQPDWGTLVFDFARPEVQAFLIANALYWLREFHIDGLRVDAVASMLYLDYSRGPGQWEPNRHGGREHLEAIEFLREANRVIHEEVPGAITVAEESTAWPGVTRRADEGGLGFDFKWNMGWMHDTLEYFALDPVHRRFHQDKLTFAMLYEHSERFIMPFSHDEVVHMKGSLFEKMPGDPWRKLAQLRLLFAYQFTRPGKKLLFMGSELAPPTEWNHDRSLEWGLADDEGRRGLLAWLAALTELYRASPCLWRGDPDPESFAWVDCEDREQSVVVYERRFAEERLVVALNLTPVPREDYRIGVPLAGRWRVRLSSDDRRFGGSLVETPSALEAEEVAYHGRLQSVRIVLPPLAALVLEPEPEG